MNILVALPCYEGNISNATFYSLFNCIKTLNVVFRLYLCIIAPYAFTEDTI